MKIFKLSLLVFLFSCSGNELKNEIIPNSFEITRYDNHSKIQRKTLCKDFRLINEKIYLNDSIIEYELIKTDTIIEKDSSIAYENVNFIYEKRIYFNKKLILVKESDSTDAIDFCDCVNSCK
jgi:hypothetical protein